MTLVQTNIFDTLSVPQDQPFELVDIFSWPGKKTIQLPSHSSFTYLIVAASAIDIEIVTTWPESSCRIFGLFIADAQRQTTWSINVSLAHCKTSADMNLISFLYDGAIVAIDGSIDINKHLDDVHGRLLEQNILLGKNISLKTLPKLNVASHNVRAAHGAKVDSLDQQKLFYMMSRGLTKEQSQALLVNGYIDDVLWHFTTLDEHTLTTIRTFLSVT